MRGGGNDSLGKHMFTKSAAADKYFFKILNINIATFKHIKK